MDNLVPKIDNGQEPFQSIPMTNQPKVKMGKSPGEDMLSPPDLSEEIDIPEATLAQWRSRGTGPEYMRIGRHVRYRRSAVDQWYSRQTIRTTMDGAA